MKHKAQSIQILSKLKESIIHQKSFLTKTFHEPVLKLLLLDSAQLCFRLYLHVELTSLDKTLKYT